MQTTDFVATIFDGRSNPNKVTVTFIMALNALLKGHTATIILMVEAVELGQPGAAAGLDIGKPFELGDSLYIVEVLERTEAQPVSLEEARPYIEDLLRERRHDELAASLQARLLDEAAVTVYPSVLDSYLGMQPRSADR